MFVEGKLFKNKEVICSADKTPKVVAQVSGYTNIISQNETARIIEKQYDNYFAIISELFGIKRGTDTPPTLIREAKLVIFQTPEVSKMTTNQQHSFDIINKNIRTWWVKDNERVDKIDGTKLLAKLWEELAN